jgi:hypothetical protein
VHRNLLPYALVLAALVLASLTVIVVLRGH